MPDDVGLASMPIRILKEAVADHPITVIQLTIFCNGVLAQYAKIADQKSMDPLLWMGIAAEIEELGKSLRKSQEEADYQLKDH